MENVHIFVLNPGPVGEGVVLRTELQDAPGIGTYITQEIKLNSFMNSASFNLGFDILPSNLRALADELEEFLAGRYEPEVFTIK